MKFIKLFITDMLAIKRWELLTSAAGALIISFFLGHFMSTFRYSVLSVIGLVIIALCLFYVAINFWRYRK